MQPYSLIRKYAPVEEYFSGPLSCLRPDVPKIQDLESKVKLCDI